MAKKIPPTLKDKEEVPIEVESWQWETPSSSRLTWRHWLALALLLGVAILFAFGFLIIAGVVLIAGLIINTALFLLKKLT